MVVILALGLGGYVFAAGSSSSVTETSIAVIGENVEMAIQNPLEVVSKWTGITIKWQDNQINPVYPGMTIGEGEITITNISPINQAAYFYASAISVNGTVWPNLEVVAKSSANVYYYQRQQIVLAPGVTINLSIEVNVPYGGPAISSFKGVKLIIVTVKPQIPPGCTPQGCG